MATLVEAKPLNQHHPGAHITNISVNMDSGEKYSKVDRNQNENVVPESRGASVSENDASSAFKAMDDVLPADCLWTCKRDDAVKLRMSDQGGGSMPPLTVPSLFQKTVKRFPHRIALSVKRDGKWQNWTFRQYYDNVCQAAKSFIKLGLEPYHSVGILGFNSPEWFISSLAAIFAGGFSTGIYATNTAEACHYIAEHCQANVIVVENHQQLKKILEYKDRLPHLKAIVQYSGDVAEKLPFLYSWSEFMALASQVPDEELMSRLRNLAPNKCCSLIYTSGTTGTPKGVMLSHDNLTWTAVSCGMAENLTYGEESTVSYLPLSHVAAQLLDIYVGVAFGGSVYFAQPDALKGTLGVTLKEVRPTFFFGVPRVWEKMMEKMVDIGRGTTGMKRKIAQWAKSVGLKGSYSQMNGAENPFGWGLANMLVFKKVRAALGLERSKFMFSGAAPITKETLDYFFSLDIPIQEVYGMSESSGPHSFGRIMDGNRVGSVGFEYPGGQTKLTNADGDGNGELCMYGRHVYMGYLDEKEKTKETIDSDGYLRTGDIARKDKDGFIFITGRIKELIITAGGENIAPNAIEDIVKEELPCVSQCMLIGDKMKFLSLLITLKTEIDPDTLEPREGLTRAALEWCHSVGSTATKLADVLVVQDAKVLRAIQAGIDRANARAISRASKIQKWSLLPKDFSVPGGELGPTMKLRRPIVVKMYAKTIAAFYDVSQSD